MYGMGFWKTVEGEKRGDFIKTKGKSKVEQSSLK